MPQKTYLTILKFGIYAAFLSVFLLFNKFLFPYITSKQIYFNILIEILFVVWLAMIVKYPEFRPKKSLITAGLACYFFAILISSIFSVDFNLSFWGDIERMLGFFHIFHFFIFYLIIISVFREEKDWRAVFTVSIIAAVLISFHSLAKTSYATIGNTAYVGGYLIFNIYFALILAVKEKNLAVKSAYLLSILPMFFAFWGLHNSGSLVGLGLSVVLLFFIYGIFNKNKKVKIATLSLFFLSVILLALVFANKNSAFVKNNATLSTITTLVSANKVTFQTRLISWKAAWRDFPSHPFLGAGYGNFAISFDKYFDPKFYNYTRSETYFDRAHNNIVDIVSTTGLLGFVTYLSIFAAVAYYLISGFKKNSIGLNDFALLSSLIVAYFIQNLAVFDSLVTYISLMVALGYIYWLNNKNGDGRANGILDEALNKIKNIFSYKNSTVNESYVIFFAGLIMFIVLYQYNIKPIKMLMGTISGQEAFAKSDFIGGVEAYKKALSYKTPLDRDSRDSLIRLISNINNLKQADKEKGAEILDYGVSLSNENLKYNQNDSLALLEHAQLLNTAAEFFKDDKEKFYYYSNLALEAVDRSIKASPGRIPIYFQKAQIYLTRGETDKAIETLNYAVSLNQDYYESVCKLARIQIITKKDEGYPNMDKCIDKGGAGELYPSGFIAQLINHYAEKNDSGKVLKLYERMAQLESKNAKILANLAQLYARAGEKEKAIEMARKAGDLDASIKDAAEGFIKQMEQ